MNSEPRESERELQCGVGGHTETTSSRVSPRAWRIIYELYTFSRIIEIPLLIDTRNLSAWRGKESDDFPGARLARLDTRRFPIRRTSRRRDVDGIAAADRREVSDASRLSRARDEPWCGAARGWVSEPVTFRGSVWRNGGQEARARVVYRVAEFRAAHCFRVYSTDPFELPFRVRETRNVCTRDDKSIYVLRYSSLRGVTFFLLKYVFTCRTMTYVVRREWYSDESIIGRKSRGKLKLTMHTTAPPRTVKQLRRNVGHHAPLNYRNRLVCRYIIVSFIFLFIHSSLIRTRRPEIMSDFVICYDYFNDLEFSPRDYSNKKHFRCNNQCVANAREPVLFPISFKHAIPFHLRRGLIGVIRAWDREHFYFASSTGVSILDLRLWKIINEKYNARARKIFIEISFYKALLSSLLYNIIALYIFKAPWKNKILFLQKQFD